MDNGDLYEFCLKDGHCTAIVARGFDSEGPWATIYEITTDPKYRYKGECQKLLKELKALLEPKGFRFGLWCPMNDIISNICDKLEIKTYEEDEC